MALGVFFGVVKIMYAAVRTRTGEIGTVRAIGFGAAPVAVSVVVEAALWGVMGALTGTAVAWIVFDGRVFKRHVSGALWLLGLEWALVTSLLGGLLPALRAGRLASYEALRAESVGPRRGGAGFYGRHSACDPYRALDITPERPLGRPLPGLGARVHGSHAAQRPAPWR